MDKLSKEKRSWNMSRVKSKDTTPELYVRSLLHRNGYRFRLHVKKLPGNPDIVLPKYKTVIFIHGCFWHRHKNCPRATMPSTRTEWWKKKLDGNVDRDKTVSDKLWERDWKVFTVWDCLIKKSNVGQASLLELFILTSIKHFISSADKISEIGINNFRAWLLRADKDIAGVLYDDEK